MNRPHELLIAIALISLLGLSSLRLWACAVPVEEGAWVETLHEDALIIWDSKTKTQHFIREAKFRSSAQNFGFLVPTPTQPKLREVSNHVFTSLKSITAAEYKPIIKKVVGKAPPPTTGAAPGSVEVLDRQTIAGYEAAVLKANDVDALADWLKTNNYAFRPALRDWLKQYTDNEWIITAFRLAGDSAGQVQTKAIQMSFAAEQPFYPYREPADVRDDSHPHDDRLLRLFVLSDTAVTGSIGHAQQDWPAQRVWSNALQRSQVEALIGALDHQIERVESSTKEVDSLRPLIGDGWWLTEFEDRTSPRPGTDELYFSPINNATPVARPPIQYERIEYVDPGTPPATKTTTPLASTFPICSLVVVVLALGAVAASVILGLAIGARRKET